MPAELERTEMEWEDIERHVLGEIKDAESFIESNVTPGREKRWDRYYGRKLGNEKKGRSRFISRDVMDTIEWMMPYFLQLFTAGEHKIKLKIKSKKQPQAQQPAPQQMQMPGQMGQMGQMQMPPQQPVPPPLSGDMIGEALRDKIDKDMDETDNNRFKLFYEWFKDALVSNTSYVKPMWFTDVITKKKTFESLNPFQMRHVANDPDLQIVDYKAGIDGNFEQVRVEMQQTIADKFQAEGVPHWEMLIPENTRDINDEFGKGQRTRVSVDYLKRVNRAHQEEGGEPYFKGLEDLEGGTQPEGMEGIDRSFSGQDSERRSYEDHADDLATEEDHGPRRMVDLVEWYDRLDVDGDGFLEDVIIWIADNKMIRWEKNAEGFIQFCSIKPIIDCYKFHGIAWADLLTDIQNLKTMLIRRTLDNFDYTNQGRWRVSPNAEVDLRSLMDNVPGEIVRGEAGEIEDLSPQRMDIQSPLALLGYTDAMKEERSGVSKINQGKMDTGTGAMMQGQMPDRGIARLMTAAQQRMDLIARIFAETGLKDFYKKSAWLYQKHMKEPFTATIRGEDRTITPEMIQGEVITQTSLTIESAVGQNDAMKIQQLFQFLSGVAQAGYPALMMPDKVYRMAQQYVSGLGWTNPDEFLPGLELFQQKTLEIAQQAQQTQQAQMQQQQQQAAQMQKATDDQIKILTQDSKIRGLKEQAKAKIDKAKLMIDAAKSKRDAKQKELDSIRDFQASILKLIQDGQGKKAQAMLERSKFRFETVKNGQS